MRTLAWRIAGAMGGGFEVGDMPMSASETAWWQDQAALLDPLAYEYVIGSNESETVPTDERWYLVNGWHLKVFDDGAGHWFHRDADVREAMLLPEGFDLETSTTEAGAFWYVCKPSLVVGVDARYDTDPRGLYFERMIRLGELELFQVGAAVTGSGQTDNAFPGGFDYGMAVQVSTHDEAWLILEESGAAGGINTLNEISDSSRIRFAESCLFPFATATFPEIRVQGVSLASGAANLTYVKLPVDW